METVRKWKKVIDDPNQYELDLRMPVNELENSWWYPKPVSYNLNIPWNTTNTNTTIDQNTFYWNMVGS